MRRAAVCDVEVEVDVEVAVLGPVDILGAAQPFARAAARELVVYLAFHRNAVRSDEWGAALWPNRSVASSTMHSTASVARRALGRTSEGVEHLPRGGRRLQLSQTVGTDVERFTRLAASSDPACWRAALDLVRGRPFEGLLLADWAVLDGTQAEVEAMVAETALRAAACFLERGCGREAEWIVRRALRACPYDERLYRALLRATDAKGDRVGLRSTMVELLSVASEGEWAIRQAGLADSVTCGSLHPRTVALFRQLSLGELPASGGDAARL
jgi:DNA-binding SARP family transcriptional activator